MQSLVEQSIMDFLRW